MLLQIIMAILVSWLLCFIFTVTDVFPPEKDKYGFYARTDARQGILTAAPWFNIPYPCKCSADVTALSPEVVNNSATGRQGVKWFAHHVTY